MNQIRLGLVSLIAFVLLLTLSPVQSREQGTTTSQSPSSKDSVELTGRRRGGQTAAALLVKARDEGTVRIIVGLRAPFQPEGKLNQLAAVRAQRGAIAQAQTNLLNRLSGVRVTGVKRLTFIPFLALEVDAAGLEQLRNLPEVATIEEDVFQPASLAESVPLVGAPAAWASGFSGSGQAVAILDTGVDKTHPFLTGKVISEACYSTTGAGATSVCPGGVAQSTATGSGVNCAVGGCDHGTHVAGIAAGKSASFSGVGRDASIIAIQVFSRVNGCTGSNCVGAFNSDILLGLQRVQTLSSSMSIAAANLSLGGGEFTENCDASQTAFKTAIDNLRSVGVATVVASGNEGNTSGMASPACVSSAISVGSTGDGSNNTLLNAVSGFSNSAPYLNLFAPGAAINSSVPGGGFSIFGGTSMSAPHVAGAWAVLKSKSPNASVSQVLAALSSTGMPVTDTRNTITKPRLKLDAAVNALSANSCSFGISPMTESFPLNGGTGMVNVTASAGCAWTAISNNSWITVTTGGSGTGNGTVNYSVAANTALARTGTIFIAGQTFIITQTGVPTLAIDDGSRESAVGLVNGGTITAVNRLTPSGYPATINAVAIFFPAGSGVSVGNGVTVLAGPNSSGSSIISGIHLNSTPATVQAVGGFNVYSIPAITISSGDFVVGMRFTQQAGALPVATDATPPLRRRSYVSTNNGVTFTLIDDVNSTLGGNFMIRALPVAGLTCPAPGSLNPTSGPIGSTFTITGIGFTGVTGVKFANNVPANFTVNSDTQITITTPGGVATGPLTISKANCADSRTATFTVTGPVITGGEATIMGENCSPMNQAIDPGEIVIISVPLKNTGSVSTGNLVATLQATGGVTPLNGTQTYGVLTTGGSVTSKSFTFLANGNCGESLTATLSLQDGTANLGTLTFNFTLGLRVALMENFDGVIPPALPAGWTSTVATGTAPPWITSAISSDTPPNNAFVTDPATTNDIRLDSPGIAINTASAQLSFRNSYDFEFSSLTAAGFDGGVLEIAIGGGAFADIVTAGGSFTAGGYNRTISSGFGNPLGGRQAWSGNSGGYLLTTVNLPAAAMGQTIRLRWRMGSDASTGGGGWRIDTIRLTDGAVCATTCTGLPPCPVITLAPATLPAGTFNVAYAQTLTASGGASPYSFMLSAGALPNGLTLSSAGVLSGTPTQGGTFNITIKATDASGCTGTQVYMLVINCPTITLSPTVLPNGAFGASYNQTLTGSGGAAPYSFALSTGTLPTGLTLALTGTLTGTPAQGGTFNITVRATDANGCTGTRSYSLVIACPTITLSPTTLPGGTVGTAYNQTISASPAGTYTFAVTAGTLPAGLSLNSATGAITGTPTSVTTASFTITATLSGGCTGSQAYTLAVQPDGCPTVTGLSPGNGPVGTPVTINGAGFAGVMAVRFTNNVTAQFTATATQITTTVPAGAATGAITILKTGCPDVRTGTFTVGNPPPVITSIEPAAVAVGGAGFLLTVRGTGFINGSQVRWNNGGRFTTFISATEVRGSIFSSDIENEGENLVTVFNPAPGGGTSTALTLTVRPPNLAPVLTSISPTVATAGGQNFTLTVTGSNFINGSIVRWNNANRTTGFVSNTQLTAMIPATDIATAGTASITVFTPEPGGGTSAARTFTINPACPTVSGLNPASGLVGAPVTINGANLTGVTAVKFSNNVTAQFTAVSAMQITTTVPSGAVTGPITVSKTGCTDVQSASFVVCSPITLSPVTLPGGTVGASYSQTVTASPSGTYNFTVTAGALPAGLSLNAATGAITGTPAAEVTANFTITALSGSQCSGSQVYSIIVIQPNPPPALTSLEPDARVVGSSGFTLALNGSGFIAASQVKWNGADRQTNFVNNTRLTIDVPASDLAAVGTASLTVVNPTPGGGASNALSFIISSPAYEADVAPRPNGTGDGTVSLADYVLIGRFVAGLDTAAVGSEFQRADCAPRETLGDGQITLTDYVQAGLYAVGLDPVVQAGGPTGPPATAQALARLLQSSSAGKASAVDARQVRALDGDLESGRSNSLAVELEATGQENALAFSLRFDAGRWRILAVKPGRDTGRATLQTNLRQQNIGRVGLTLTLPPGQTLAAGRREVVTLFFAPLHTALAEPVPLGFSDEPIAREVVDAWANALPATFTTETARPAIGTLTNVSAASMRGAELSPGAIAAAFGINLATATQAADTLPLPASLAGTLVKVTDNAGVERLASLFFVSASQVNYQVPPDTAPGLAIVTIISGDGAISTGTVEIAESSPGLFAANADGQGVAAAVALRVKADGSQQFEPVAVFGPAQQRFVAAPIDVGGDGEQVFLILHGTGLRTRGDLSKVTATIGGVRAEVLYAGAQGEFAGLDQINLRLPRELAGRGEVELVLKANGKVTNVVKVVIR